MNEVVKTFKIDGVTYTLRKASDEYYYLFAQRNDEKAELTYIYVSQPGEEDGKTFTEFIPAKIETERRLGVGGQAALKRCERYFESIRKDD